MTTSFPDVIDYFAMGALVLIALLAIARLFPPHDRAQQAGVACLHSLGASGGPLISSTGFVSREWAAIQSTASSLKTNFPKWFTAPFGHTICTRQMSPSRTGNKTVQCVCVSIKLKYAPLDETDKPFG